MPQLCLDGAGAAKGCNHTLKEELHPGLPQVISYNPRAPEMKMSRVMTMMMMMTAASITYRLLYGAFFYTLSRHDSTESSQMPCFTDEKTEWRG